MKSCWTLLLFACLPLASCGNGFSSDQAPESRFLSEVDHTYFPIAPGTLWIYEGETHEQRRREEVRAQAQERVPWGVDCIPVVEEVFLDGALTEVTTEWYAQDREGNVWKFGEETLELHGEAFVRTEDSWEAGLGGAKPWMVFTADPQVGDVHRGHYPGGYDEYRVTSLSETAAVPAGWFIACMRVVENILDPEDGDIILYAPGVGRVSEVNSTGGLHLVTVQGPR